MSASLRTPSPDGLAAGGPNLARRPFANERPVQRISLLLLAAAAVLLLADLWLYVGYTTTRRATASQLDVLEAQIETEGRALAEAERALAEAEIEQQNELVDFMNQRIAERTFGWSVLFDRLAGLQPQDVRLDTLAPSFVGAEGRRAVPAADSDPSRRVALSMQGRARSGEAILELVDALFADPAFTDPNLSRETRQGGEVAFDLTVVYLPRAAEQLAQEARLAEQAGRVEATPPDAAAAGAGDAGAEAPAEAAEAGGPAGTGGAP